MADCRILNCRGESGTTRNGTAFTNILILTLTNADKILLPLSIS